MSSTAGNDCITACTPPLLERIAATMRSGDCLELMAARSTPLEGLRASVEASFLSGVLMLDNEPAVAFGLSRLSSGSFLDFRQRSCLWMLTSNQVFRRPKRFLRAVRAVLPALRAAGGDLENAIDIRYKGALRLAASCGFTFGKAFEYGQDRLLFVPVCLKRW